MNTKELSRGELECAVQDLWVEVAELKERLAIIRNDTIEECARQAYNDASIEAAILGLRKGVSK